MKEEEIKALQELLSTPKKIVIIPHRSPDGDAIGSTLGLYHFLKKLNHTAVVVAPNEFPDFLAWLPSADEVRIYEKEKEQTSELILNADLVCTLDFNAFHRTGDMEHILKKVTAPILMIDHHQKPDDYATFQFSDTAYGSTCEMVYHFIAQLGFKNMMDKTIATCIYTGIVTDSGSFRFPSTTSTTHRVAAELIDLGIQNGAIHNALFDTSSYDRLQLLGQALQNMKLIRDKKTSYITLTQSELDRYHYVKGDTEGIVNYGLSVDGIVFTAIFIEHKEENIIKISFRSQGDFDVNQFARTHFNGGGHINAAGGKSYLSMRETVAKFLDLLSTTTLN